MAIKITFDLESDCETIARLILAYENADQSTTCGHDHDVGCATIGNFDAREVLTVSGIDPAEIFGDNHYCTPVLDPVDAATNDVPGDLSEDVPEYDSAGIRYDTRIHSAGKTKCADGTWRAKKGLNPVIKAQVEGELRLLGNVPPPPAQVATASTAEVVAVVPPPPVEVVAAVPPPPPATGTVKFSDLLIAMTTAKLTPAQMAEQCALCVPPVAEFKDLSTRPDAWPQIIARLRA